MLYYKRVNSTIFCLFLSFFSLSFLSSSSSLCLCNSFSFIQSHSHTYSLCSLTDSPWPFILLTDWLTRAIHSAHWLTLLAYTIHSHCSLTLLAHSVHSLTTLILSLTDNSISSLTITTFKPMRFFCSQQSKLFK